MIHYINKFHTSVGMFCTESTMLFPLINKWRFLSGYLLAVTYDQFTHKDMKTAELNNYLKHERIETFRHLEAIKHLSIKSLNTRDEVKRAIKRLENKITV